MLQMKQQQHEKKREVSSSSIWNNNIFFFGASFFLIVAIISILTRAITTFSPSSPPSSSSVQHHHQTPAFRLLLSSQQKKKKNRMMTQHEKQSDQQQIAEDAAAIDKMQADDDVADVDADADAAAAHHNENPKQQSLSLSSASSSHHHTTNRNRRNEYSFPITPPHSCFDKLEQQQETAKKKKLRSSIYFRAIPRTNANGGTDTKLLLNVTADECAYHCRRAGVQLCTHFVRDRASPRAVSLLFDDVLTPAPKKKPGGGGYSSMSEYYRLSRGNKILHPVQARDDYLFSTYADEVRHRNTRSRCWLRIGVLDPTPHRGREVYAPLFVQEDTKIAVPPGYLSPTEGTYSKCEVTTALPPRQRRRRATTTTRTGGEEEGNIKTDDHGGDDEEKGDGDALLPPVSSLVAVGLLAGAPYLEERVFTALETWLKDEPNLVAFVDRKPQSIATVKKYLPRSSLSSSSTSPRHHHRKDDAKIEESSSSYTSNPLFACVSMGQLNALYNEYPEVGGDAPYSDDWDADIAPTPSSASSDQQKKHHHQHGGDDEPSSVFPFPFFCNPDEPTRPQKYSYKRPDAPGLTAPIPTSSVLAARRRQRRSIPFLHHGSGSGSVSNSSIGYTLFRFIREPDHQTLKLFNGAWKNFIILYELPLFYPTASWYISVDDDTIVLWRNLRYLLLLASLSNLHRRDDIYGGFAEWGSTMFFIHGGGGMLLSHGTMWRAHKHLPGCLPMCRDKYGDVRVGCCMHSIEIYERRFKSLWPYTLEKVPEQWTNLLSSVHGHRKRSAIAQTWEALESEFLRKTNATRMETMTSNTIIVDVNGSISSTDHNGRRRAKQNMKKMPTTNNNNRRHMQRFFLSRSAAWKQWRENNSVLPYQDQYLAGTSLFDELLFSPETWRLSKMPRRTDVQWIKES